MEDKKQILVVDDMAISLSAIERTLKDTYDIVTVNSGIRALKYLEVERPDLILLDIRMAGKDGIETLKEIRNLPNGKAIPVIMLTSAHDRKTVIESSKLGIYDYILKPFEPRDLRGRVQFVFAKVQDEREQKEKEDTRLRAETRRKVEQKVKEAQMSKADAKDN